MGRKKKGEENRPQKGITTQEKHMEKKEKRLGKEKGNRKEKR